MEDNIPSVPLVTTPLITAVPPTEAVAIQELQDRKEDDIKEEVIAVIKNENEHNELWNRVSQLETTIAELTKRLQTLIPEPPKETEPIAEPITELTEEVVQLEPVPAENVEPAPKSKPKTKTFLF